MEYNVDFPMRFAEKKVSEIIPKFSDIISRFRCTRTLEVCIECNECVKNQTACSALNTEQNQYSFNRSILRAEPTTEAS